MWAENYVTLMKEIKEGLNKWEDVYPWTGRLKLVQMSILPKLTNRFNTIPIKTSTRVFVNADKITPQCIWRGRGNRIAKQFWKRKSVRNHST